MQMRTPKIPKRSVMRQPGPALKKYYKNKLSSATKYPTLELKDSNENVDN